MSATAEVQTQVTGRVGEGIVMADRRESVWNDPKLWVSVCGLLLTLVLTAFTFLNSKLSSIDSSLQSTRDLVLVVQTRQESERATADAKTAAIIERLSKVETAVDTQQRAYNFHFSNRLAAVEAKNGIKPQKEN
jgi:hypothetical protein